MAKKPVKKQQEVEEEEYDNSNTGALFPNKRKKKPSHPDYQGQMTDKDGNEYWISGWKKTSRKDGSHYMSLSFTPKEDIEEEEHEEEKPAKSKGGSKNELPWD